ncbi:MAG: hypothetical protein HZA46_04735 [Planctomycetales bacterium]|nr:hypothetical protein [Planctomycetales bacterium]
MSSTVCLSLVAIALAGCSSGESPAPVSSSATSPPSVAINDVSASGNSETPDEAPLDSSLVTLQLPGMT